MFVLVAFACERGGAEHAASMLAMVNHSTRDVHVHVSLEFSSSFSSLLFLVLPRLGDHLLTWMGW